MWSPAPSKAQVRCPGNLTGQRHSGLFPVLAGPEARLPTGMGANTAAALRRMTKMYDVPGMLRTRTDGWFSQKDAETSPHPGRTCQLMRPPPPTPSPLPLSRMTRVPTTPQSRRAEPQASVGNLRPGTNLTLCCLPAVMVSGLKTTSEGGVSQQLPWAGSFVNLPASVPPWTTEH